MHVSLPADFRTAYVEVGASVQTLSSCCLWGTVLGRTPGIDVSFGPKVEPFYMRSFPAFSIYSYIVRI